MAAAGLGGMGVIGTVLSIILGGGDKATDIFRHRLFSSVCNGPETIRLASKARGRRNLPRRAPGSNCFSEARGAVRSVGIGLPATLVGNQKARSSTVP